MQPHGLDLLSPAGRRIPREFQAQGAADLIACNGVPENGPGAFRSDVSAFRRDGDEIRLRGGDSPHHTSESLRPAQRTIRRPAFPILNIDVAATANPFPGFAVGM
jgi:hypothetical protein